LFRSEFMRAVLAVCALGLCRTMELNLPLFARELFANRIGAFFGMDVLVSAIVLIVFMRLESSRLNVPRRWIPVLAVLLVGVSLAFPLFL
jgi:hypothetical protein